MYVLSEAELITLLSALVLSVLLEVINSKHSAYKIIKGCRTFSILYFEKKFKLLIESSDNLYLNF